MSKEVKKHIIASLGTAVFMLLLLLLLYYVQLGRVEEAEEEGIEISFGAEEGAAEPAPTPAPTMPVSETVADAVSNKVPEVEPEEFPQQQEEQQDVMTQEEEEALALQRQQEEEKRRRQAEAIAKANAFSSKFSNTPAETGTGEGSGQIGGNDWSLEGRSPVGGIPAPHNDFSGEGTVTVRIVVDGEGNVTGATVQTEGTNTSDANLRRLAVEAAKKAKFNRSAQTKAVGTITYHFKQK